MRPFRALTYRQRDPGHLARVSSPAYDLVTTAARDRLATADPHNVVRLILPEPAGPGEAVRQPADRLRLVMAHAARTLREWETAGVLQRDDRPALWVYELRPSDGTPATIGWLGAVALPPPGSPAVLPHEDTFPAAVEGRRALLAATETDLEPIVLAHDPDQELSELTAAARSGEPSLRLVDDDGVDHRLWRVTDVDVLAGVGAALARTTAVIADGHHRFAAAQAHAREVRGTPEHPAVLALVTPMGPGGLRVEPIHRVVPGLDLATAAASAARGFRVTPLDVPDDAALRTAVRDWQADPGRSGFLVTDGTGLLRLDRPDDAVRAAVPTEAPSAWQRLDVVLAHHGLFQRLWGLGDGPDDVLVAHDLAQALQSAVERGGVAVLLRAPSPGDVAAVARAGARMPRKSTLFVPKPRTGLVFRPHGA
ncbi:DUF1015 domain-containing protein [Trujillonella endophytica]|uniref:Uncharacterized conserved protein, DUF1015 family n=1 Tax=Trujillonella endophytica TaxID=673521 RepID=A0A1H8T9N2_9ACTN|nr:DUF1015 domain-containing protein [Trujillella endophytica]SEO87208.1 Uncharacterized conserved protein, DUF1015 family [Trujillella endophytica]